MARLSSRSKPRRFGISSRKSVSADASSSSIRSSALANWVLSRRIVSLVPLDATGAGDEVAGAAFPRHIGGGAVLVPAVPLLRRFAAGAPIALVFFFMETLGGLPGFTKTG